MKRYRSSATSAFAAIVWLGLLATAFAQASEVLTQPMDAHMQISVRAQPAPGDRARAAAIVAAARTVMAQYPTVEAAERGGFTKFLPTVALPLEHYTNKAYAIEASVGAFDPLHPTSLIFKRNGSELTLVGVMYTAARDADTADIDRRVPW